MPEVLMVVAGTVLLAGLGLALLGRFHADRNAAGVQQAREEVERVARELRQAVERAGVLVRQRDEVAQETLRRVAAYLEGRVAEPLRDGIRTGQLRGAARRAVSAIEDLAFFTHEIRVEPGDLDLVKAVRDTVEEYSGEWQIPVNLEVPPGHHRVTGDAEALKDALYLILTNAGQFGGGAPVDLALEEGPDRYAIRVRDAGPGFSAEALERGMDPFFSTQEGALGLGLPTARRIVEAHGGRLALRNREEGGGEVEIRLRSNPRRDTA